MEYKEYRDNVMNIMSREEGGVYYKEYKEYRSTRSTRSA